MTLATYTSDLTDIYLFEATTSVGAYGGGGAGLSASPDLAIEGTNCVDKQVSNAEKGFLRDNTSNFTIGADDHFYIWVVASTPGLNDTRNNRGVVVAIGDDTSNFVKFHVDGSDTLPRGGMQPYTVRFVNTTLANFRTLVGTPGTTPSQIGGGCSTTATVKGANLGVDAARIGTGYDILNGTGVDPEANFAGIEADDVSTAEGVLVAIGGGFELRGKLRIGSSTTPCEFLDSDVQIIVPDTRHSLTDFSEVLVEHASSILTLTRVTFKALGTNNPGRFEMLSSAASAPLTSVTFDSWGVSILGSGTTVSASWINCDVVTANGGDLTGSSITGYEGTADTAGLVWNVNTDPDGLIDDMVFTKGTAATHAVEFGASAPLTMTIRDIVTSGYNASDANNDSTFLFADRGSDVTWTLNVIGGTGNFSFKKARAGDTVNIVLDPVTTLITVTDENAAALASARVLFEAGDGTGDLPFLDTVTITRSGATASVSHTAHGMDDGDKVVIRGADQQEYNGVFAITNTTTNAYDYTVSGAPATPATGTISASGVIVEGLTNGSGQVSASKAYSVDQNGIGVVRKATTTPLYKSFDFTDTTDNVNGLTKGIQMIRDD